MLQFAVWFGGVLGELIRAWNGSTPLDTNQEILMVFMLVASAPEAFLSLGTIIIDALSGDLSPSFHEHEIDSTLSDRDSSDDGMMEGPMSGHLPRTEETINGVTIDTSPNH